MAYATEHGLLSKVHRLASLSFRKKKNFFFLKCQPVGARCESSYRLHESLKRHPGHLPIDTVSDVSEVFIECELSRQTF